jgi:gamma-glutamyltranspeptidase/glutathione hydrolase
MYDLEDEQDVQGPSRRFSWMKVKNNANTEGYTSIAIPGTVAGLTKALEKWGTIDLDQAVAPAVKLARDGFPLPRAVALSLSERHALLSRFSNTADVYLSKGSPLSPGSHFMQSEHADTLERLGRVGASELYGGETGARIAEDIEQNGGYLRLSDLEQYRPIVREQVLSASYRGVGISAVEGPCAGPTVLEILNILEQFDIAAMGYGTLDSLHTIIEAVKLSAVDRFSFMGDPAVYGFPIDVLAKPEYAVNRAMNIDSSMATVFSAGDPWSFTEDEKPRDFPVPAGASPDSGTTSLSVADKDGNMVALTQTNLGFSGVVNPGVGVMMNNAMGWSAPMPGTVNSIAPFARALNNMTPMILHKKGQAVMAIGGSGGRRIWPAVAQVIINRIDFEMGLQEAIEKPRIHVETDDPVVDRRFGDSLLNQLKRKGHNPEFPPKEFILWPFSEPNGIVLDGGHWKSGLNPQAKPTHAVGY